MKAEFKGTYGSNETEATIFYYNGWYCVEGSVNVNRTHQELYDGVNVEELEDYDIITASEPINELNELVELIDE